MQIIDGEHFNDLSVELDGKHFINCTFTNCTLEYQGGEVAFDRTVMRGCRHLFYGRARRTLQYLQGVGLMDYDPTAWGECAARVH